jgi:hypothetical protein
MGLGGSEQLFQAFDLHFPTRPEIPFQAEKRGQHHGTGFNVIPPGRFYDI